MATLKQIQARLKKLRAQAESLIADRAQSVLDEIRAMMERHGITTDDIARHGKKTKRAAKPNVTYPAPAGRHEAMTKLAKKGKLPAKYRNPKTGETWSGWARPPAWIANVKDRSKFLIDAESAEHVESAARPKAAAKKAAAKKTPVAAKKARSVQARAVAAKKKATAPSANKTGAAKSAATPVAKRAPRKSSAKVASPPQQDNAGAAQPAPDTPPAPTTNDGASA